MSVPVEIVEDAAALARAAARERERLVVAEKPEGKDAWRVTCTLPVLNAAALLWLVDRAAAGQLARA